jgi:peptidoglycan pentaglycine glycine transferase (the first glycine)
MTGERRVGPPTGSALGDDGAWDAFVEAADPGSYLQLSGWATVKRVNGWRMARVGTSRAAAQILIRRPRPLPWGLAYAPRGPVAVDWDPPTIEAFSRAVLTELPRLAGRISHLRIDPEIEVGGVHDPGGSTVAALRSSGWRPGQAVQPSATRVIDLSADEGALWGDLRKKWRQYVNKARAGGVVVRDVDGDRLGDFYRIYRETASRAGFLIRAESAYRDIWAAFRPGGHARLLFAELPDGEPVAALFLVRSGRRVVEPYGGMTALGADTRANYLLKWEAIRSSREQGATTYDLWGLAHPGIAHFKTGFGGREVVYIGAWDLVLDPLGRRTFDLAQRARVVVERRRHGLGGSGSASAFGSAGEGGGQDAG